MYVSCHGNTRLRRCRRTRTQAALARGCSPPHLSRRRLLAPASTSVFASSNQSRPQRAVFVYARVCRASFRDVKLPNFTSETAATDPAPSPPKSANRHQRTFSGRDPSGRQGRSDGSTLSSGGRKRVPAGMKDVLYPASFVKATISRGSSASTCNSCAWL